MSNENQQARLKTLSTLKILNERSNIAAISVEQQKHFSSGIWVASDKLIKVIKNYDTLHFENAMNNVHHERRNIVASFAEHLTFPE